MKKRLFAVFISLSMVLGTVPFTAFAEETVEDTAVCSCDEVCTEDIANKDCAVCMEDYSRCNGTEDVEKAVCDCKTLCGEEDINTDCAVCAEDFSMCAGEKETEEKDTKEKKPKAKGARVYGDMTEISDAAALLEILNSKSADETEGKKYIITNDIEISAADYTRDSGRIFAGDIDGNNCTITVNGDGGALFDTLRGSVSNLNIVFNDNAEGSTFAIDAGVKDDNINITLENISIVVKGDILPVDHDYLDYYASLLQPPYNYGNWYIHFGGEAKNLATGFSWYVWGADVNNVSVTVDGNIGMEQTFDQDTTSTGFAYFAATGDAKEAVTYSDITIDVTGDIQSYTGDGHASAYGFAVGNTDSTAGFGCKTLKEFANVTVNAENIIADSQEGSSSAFGMARFMQGYTHDCEVNVENEIKAVNAEGDAEEDVYAYSNGDAYAYGFMLNTSGGAIEDRRNFENNTVNAGAITAVTDSEEYAGGAFASGFAHQMTNTASSVPDLTYNNNKVNVTDGGITAESNAGGAVAAGFTTSSGRDYYDRPDHIYENSVYVKGSIKATSLQADATAAGYSYKSKTHRRDCDVTVEGSIIAESPNQAVASGFNGLQSIDNYYFIKNADVKVYGDIKAVQTENEEGIAVAAGLNAVVMDDSAGSASTVVSFSGNKVEVGGVISAEKNENEASGGFAGLIVGLNEHTDPQKGTFDISNNHFIGREALIQIDDADKETYPGLYTMFADVSDFDMLSDHSGNTLQFTDENGRVYNSDVELIQGSQNSSYGAMWELTKIEEVITGYEITAEAGENGTIDPSGTVKVDKDEDQTFIIEADKGYVIDKVLVDGDKEKDASGETSYEYTFKNVNENHTISATFKEKEDDDSSSSSGGSSYSLSSDAYYVRYHNGEETVKDGKYGEGARVEIKDDVFEAPLGRVLAGWSTKEGGDVEYIPGDIIRMPGKTLNLYAVWEEETQTHNAYINGYPDDTFGPDKTITRAEAAVMFYNLLSEKSGYLSTFTDVPAGQWYSDAVITLAGMGVVNGYPDGTFRPDAPITRAEFVTMALNFAKADKGTACAFADVSENMWYYGAVAGATENGWISGYPDGTFGPERYITRGEVTSVINRMENRAADLEFIKENLSVMNTFTDLSSDHWAYGSVMEAANGHKYVRDAGNAYEVWTEIQ